MIEKIVTLEDQYGLVAPFHQHPLSITLRRPSEKFSCSTAKNRGQQEISQNPVDQVTGCNHYVFYRKSEL